MTQRILKGYSCSSGYNSEFPGPLVLVWIVPGFTTRQVFSFSEQNPYSFVNLPTWIEIEEIIENPTFEDFEYARKLFDKPM